jgi:hypothetical protein
MAIGLEIPVAIKPCNLTQGSNSTPHANGRTVSPWHPSGIILKLLAQRVEGCGWLHVAALSRSGCFDWSAHGSDFDVRLINVDCQVHCDRHWFQSGTPHGLVKTIIQGRHMKKAAPELGTAILLEVTTYSHEGST